MGLRCLLGHDFGEAEIERDREEDGDQMVVTIRELETCQRCGTERVISENKEVTSIRSPGEVGLESEDRDADDAVGADDAGSDDAALVDSGPESESTDADAVGDEPASGGGSEPGRTADADETIRSAGGTVDEGVDDPEADDGVILSEEDRERERGEWPDAEQVGGDPTARGADGDEGSDIVDDAVQPDDDTDSAGTARSEGANPGTRTAVDDEPASDAAEPGSTAAEPGSTAAEPAVADGESEDVEIIGDDDGNDDPTAGASGAAEGDGTGASAEDDADSTAGREGSEGFTGDGDETAAWPDHGGEDEGFDAEVDGAGDVSFSGNGLTPDVDAETPGSDAEYVETDVEGAGAGEVEDRGGRVDVDTGIAREDTSSIDLSEVSEDTKFYCPNCGLTRSTGESSMRAGDICPECRKGYIAEHED